MIFTFFQVHKSTSDMQKALDKAVLPKEYGGTVPIKEMIGKFLYIIKKNKKLMKFL